MSQQATSQLVAFLNEQYPQLPVVMYDIGARYGIHYLYTELLKLSHFSVIGFEPDQQEATKLNSSKQSGIKKTFPVAIAESKGRRTLYITKHPGCSSLYCPKKDVLEQYSLSDLLEVVDTTDIETISLDEFTKEFDVAQPDFLKIDVQGAEYEVLQGGKLTITDNVIGIFLETHLREIYTDAPLFTDIHHLLTHLGFRLIFCEYNPNLGGEIVEFDVAYVKDITLLKKEEDLLKAILFCLIHQNINFAANLIRRANLSEPKKIEILNLLSQPLHPEKLLVQSDDLYINSKVEMRKIREDWWESNPVSL